MSCSFRVAELRRAFARRCQRNRKCWSVGLQQTGPKRLFQCRRIRIARSPQDWSLRMTRLRRPDWLLARLMVGLRLDGGRAHPVRRQGKRGAATAVRATDLLGTSARGVWDLSPFARGFRLEHELGGNLAPGFPTVDV